MSLLDQKPILGVEVHAPRFEKTRR